MASPVALTPILIACARERSWKRRFFQGWASGFVFCSASAPGFSSCLKCTAAWDAGEAGERSSYSRSSKDCTWPCSPRSPDSSCIAGGYPRSAALWTGLERTHGPFGFAWLDLGNAGIDMPALMRLAPITGVYGLSFVFAMIACAVALIALRRRAANWPGC